MNKVTPSEFKAIKAKAKAKKAKRRANVNFNAKISGRPKLSSLKKLAKILWDVLTEYVHLRDGPICRICKINPGYALFHLIPQNEGNAVRYDPDCVVWGCKSCNCDEKNHRAFYARKFEEMFGKPFMDMLWTRAKPVDANGKRIHTQFRRPDYIRMIAEVMELRFALTKERN